jgi:UDP-N-acetylglucosamine 1-carboxyvinyltransferase
MSRFIIQGGQSLSGEIKVSGAKNAALKMMTAALLTDEQIYLKNVPDISDIRTMKDILVKLGAKINFDQHQMAVDCSGVKVHRPDYELVKHMRGSVVIIGPLLSRFGEVVIPQPGGCLIGARSIDTHISALQQLNVTVNQDKDCFYFKTDHLEGNKVILEEMSVTTTENVLMAAVLAKGETEIRLAAAEPEIEDLANMLIKMGAKIKGAGTTVIKIRGVNKLHGAEHQVIPDRIEAGTFAIAAAVSRGDVRVKNINSSHIDFVLHKFKQANITFELEDNNTCLHIKPTTIFNPINVDTRPYPGFPTDLQAPISVLLTQAKGTSKIFETMYEGRIGYIKELKKMGADINAVDVHTIVINGPTPLYGKEIISFDIRAGATLIIAALIAQGESVIDRVELVDRGYEDIDGRLRKIGAKIKRVK